MRKVNIITYDLIKKEFNLTNIKKGETINIISTECTGINWGVKTVFKKVKAR
jgi:hypothetical protein